MTKEKNRMPGNGMENDLTYSPLRKEYYMDMQQQMEERLWDFIDGQSTPDEQVLIRRLIAEDPAWERRYNELMHIDQALNHAELDAPSLRFTKNVMEQIAKYHVAPATKNYINKNVIRGITGFFLVMIIGILIYLFARVHWTGTSTDSLIPQYNIDANKLNWGKALSNTYVNIFILINVILGFILLDKYLQGRRKSGKHGAV